jgi:hypothetical protein
MTKLPYADASSGEKALSEIQKILRSFGCDRFGSMIDDREGVVIVQFEHRGRPVSVKASINGYAAAWLKANPWSRRTRRTQVDHERKAREIASTAVYSILRDWIKGQTAAIETGILSFEGAFLGQLVLTDGRTVLEHASSANMLPPPRA